MGGIIKRLLAILTAGRDPKYPDAESRFEVLMRDVESVQGIRRENGET